MTVASELMRVREVSRILTVLALDCRKKSRPLDAQKHLSRAIEETICGTFIPPAWEPGQLVDSVHTSRWEL